MSVHSVLCPDVLTLNSVVGFDIEWRPTFVKGRPENRVACIQLADQTSVVVMQVFAMNGLPQVLVKILQDSSIMKVGVGIFGARSTEGVVDPLTDEQGTLKRSKRTAM